MDNYQQNTNNGNKKNYTMILILIEYLIVIWGIFVVFISMPTWEPLRINAAPVEPYLFKTYIALSFFLITPMVFTFACLSQQKKCGAERKAIVINLIITLLPIICLIILVAQAFFSQV